MCDSELSQIGGCVNDSDRRHISDHVWGVKYRIFCWMSGVKVRLKELRQKRSLTVTKNYHELFISPFFVRSSSQHTVSTALFQLGLEKRVWLSAPSYFSKWPFNWSDKLQSTLAAAIGKRNCGKFVFLKLSFVCWL